MARIGEEFLAPGFHAYDKWLQYQTYDVTELLTSGYNAIGAVLGNGWAKGRIGLSDRHGVYTDKFVFLIELHVTMKDGARRVICTDETWKCAPSEVMFDSIYDGEHVDARKAIKNWSDFDLDDSTWQSVVQYTPKVGELSARISPQIKSKIQLNPIEVIKTPIGETVLDMGQNMVGWLEVYVDLPQGSRLKLTFGEILQQDCFYTDNLRTAKQEYIYISDGVPGYVRPRFTFYGFRYIKVEGWRGEVLCKDFIGHVLYSDLDDTGVIETSNTEVNRLFLNTVWGQRGNFVDVPTDCPQRDERLGWTGDSQVFSGTAMFNMDCFSFYRKYLRDLREEQKAFNGSVPHVVPDVLGALDGSPAAGAVAWADAATVLPWNVYLFTGDISILEECYDSMKAWVDWVTRADNGERSGFVWAESFHFGDWLALDNYSAPKSCFGGTDNAFLCSVYYLYSARLVASAAEALGKTDDAIKYKQLADDIREALQNEFFTPNARLALNTQTAYVLSLFLGLSPNNKRTAKDSVAQLEKDNMHLKTGFIGTPWLCRALSLAGENEAAYTLFLNRDYPSWLYEVAMGATTIWERWNSVLPNGLISDTGMNSLNHYAYGSIIEWVYRDVCGLNPKDSHPGFKDVLIAPNPDKRLGYVRCEVLTAAGRFKSGWSFDEDGRLTVKVTVPFDAAATIRLPHALASEVQFEGDLILHQDGDYTEIQLVSGEYMFKYTVTE